MAAKPVRVWFVHRKAHRTRGTFVMRGQQLCEMARRHGSGRFEYGFLTLPHTTHPAVQSLWVALRPAGDIYIFTKKAIRKLKPGPADRLHRKSEAVIYDHVDTKLSELRIEGADAHLCSSFAQQAHFRNQAGRTVEADRFELLLHGADVRLQDLRPPDDRPFRAAYCGRFANAYLPPEVLSELTVLGADETVDMDRVLSELSGFPMHYGVRAETEPQDEIIPPFTKGATAAACDANIVVDRATPDAVTLLGEDYPYMVAGRDPELVRTALRRAREDYGGPRWQEGLERMRALSERVAPQTQVRELEAILTRALGRR